MSNQDGTKAIILEELTKMNLSLDKLLNVNKQVGEQAPVPAKPKIYSLLGKDISVENSKIYSAAIRDDWDSAKGFFKDKEKLKVKLSPSGDTALHIAVGTNSSHNFVEEIVKMYKAKFSMPELRVKNHSGDTALHIAARVGNVTAAKLLVFEDPQMVEVPNNYNHVPLWVAAWGNDADTLHYLLSATLKEDLELNRNGFCIEPKDDIKFLFVCIESGHYDVALCLIEKYPHFVWEGTPLNSLASKPDAFRSGIRLRYVEYYFYELIYSRFSFNKDSLTYKLPATKTVINETPWATKDGENVFLSHMVVPVWKGLLNNIMRCFLMHNFLELINLLPVCFREVDNFLCNSFTKVAYIKKVHDDKLRHKRAELLVTEICYALLQKAPDNVNVYDDVLQPAICTAIKNGCIELIEKCIEEYPGTIWCTDPEYSFMGLAIKHRREKVFNLIYQMSAYKIHTFSRRDNLQNALHVAGELPPYHRLSIVTGPALQMQRELLWFQKVEKFTETSSLHFRNKEDMTPREVFTEQHKGLLRNAQDWTKATSTSSTVVAALIVTMTFAAMCTVPGGS